MRKDIKKIFKKYIGDNAKLYEVINASGLKMYVIEEEMNGEYVEIFSCVAVDGEPESMIEAYLATRTIERSTGYEKLKKRMF